MIRRYSRTRNDLGSRFIANNWHVIVALRARNLIPRRRFIPILDYQMLCYLDALRQVASVSKFTNSIRYRRTIHSDHRFARIAALFSFSPVLKIFFRTQYTDHETPNETRFSRLAEKRKVPATRAAPVSLADRKERTKRRIAFSRFRAR